MQKPMKLTERELQGTKQHRCKGGWNEQYGSKRVLRLWPQASGDKLLVRECDEKIRRYLEKYNQISEITGIDRNKKRMTLTNVGDGDKIKIETVKPNIVIEGHSGTPKIADVNSVIDHKDINGKVDIRSFYGSEGYKKTDIHTTDHENQKQHPFGKHGEHAEDYEWDNAGKLKNKIRRELTDIERKENGDIL